MKTLQNTTMRPNDQAAVTEAAHLLQQHFPVGQVILFGSKARGDDDEYSDIDLLLLTSRTLHWKEEKAIVDILFEVGMKYDVLFTPLDVPMPDWDDGIFTTFSIYQDIIRDGVIVL
jgi:uncharacterized protein